jgi:ATP-dependent Clp protease adapter protein ClpS
VVEVLRVCFGKSDTEATEIMLKAHTSGVGLVQIYSMEVAEMKCEQANQYAHDHEKLLIFSYEEV